MNTTRCRILSVWTVVACVVAVAASSQTTAAEPETSAAAANAMGAPLVARDIILDDVPLGRLTPLPDVMRVSHHYAGEEGGLAQTHGPNDKLIYENVEGRLLFAPMPLGFRVADDIMTEAIGECDITEVTVQVNGGVEGGDEEFTAHLELWTGCPGTTGTSMIPGTQATFDGLSDDIEELHILHLPMPDGSIVLPPNFWIRMYFDTPDSGWVIGAPATRGFSTDSYFHPFTGCDTYLGGYPPYHASFYAEIWSDESCERHHLSYLAATASAPTFIPPGGANNAVADDLVLIEDDCVLSAYQLGTRGTTGPFEMSIDLRQHPTNSPYAGTERVFYGKGQGSLEVAYFTIPEEEVIELPKTVYISWKANRGGVGVLNIGRTQAGFSDHTYWVKDLPGFPGWTIQPDVNTGARGVGGRDAIFYVAIFCRGEPPRGACCPNQQPGAPETVCENNRTVLACLSARWQKDEVCGLGDDDPFTPECGTHGCCSPIDPGDPGNSSGKVCGNRFFDDCDAITDPTEDERPCTGDRDCAGVRKCQSNGLCEPKKSRWFSGEFCGEYGFDCPFFVCFDGEGDCFDYEDEIVCDFDWECPLGRACIVGQGERICEARLGCGNLRCCDAVCAGGQANRYCCTVAWDWICAEQAADQPECAFPPGNDSCHDDNPAKGAAVIDLGTSGDLCTQANNENATLSGDEPGFCCHNGGVNRRAYGTIWYKFQATHSSSRIQTCDTAGSIHAANSLIQVFKTADSDRGKCHDGSPCDLGDPDCLDGTACVYDEEYACDNLTVIGCNDDSPGCGAGNIESNSDVCVSGLLAGDWYYVLLGGNTPNDQGSYNLCIKSPCPTMPPPEDACLDASFISTGITPFDLMGSTLECPAEAELRAMKNDVWRQYRASCTGNLTIHTCGPTDSPDDDPDTTLAVYEGLDCPPSESSLVAWNDDAVIDQHCSLSGDSCFSADDCLALKCSASGTACNEDGDCRVCVEGDNDGQPCTTNLNCEGGTCELSGETCDLFPESACSMGGAACMVNADCDIGSCGGDALACSVSAHENPLICSDNQRCNLVEECIQWRCSGTLSACQDDGDCKVCVEGINDGQPCITNMNCQGGTCESSGDTCDLRPSEQWACSLSGTPCTSLFNCDVAECSEDASLCSFQAHQGLGICDSGQGPCTLAESCRRATCDSVCGKGSYLEMPVFNGQYYLLRLGGSFGGEPIGDLTIECVVDDCQPNAIPDLYDIQAGLSEDCNQNGEPDECEIDVNSTAGGGPYYCTSDCDPDCQDNGKPDCCDIDADDGGCCETGVCDTDTNRNGVPDGCEGAAGACCVSGSPCAEVSEAACTAAGGTFEGDGTSCTPDPCPVSNCTTLDSSSPPNCAIDARQPSQPDGTSPDGWQQVELTFNAECDTATLADADFLVEVLPDGTAPTINNVVRAGNVATLEFSPFVEVEKWTCFSHNDTAGRTCLGYLPANVNSDSTSNPAIDLSALIDCLNSPGTCDDWQENINRDSAANVADLTRLIDLYNGAASYANWTGAGIDPCP